MNRTKRFGPKAFEDLAIEMANLGTDYRIKEMDGKLSREGKKALKAIDALFDAITPIKVPKKMEGFGAVDAMSLVISYSKEREKTDKIVKGCKRCTEELRRVQGVMHERS